LSSVKVTVRGAQLLVKTARYLISDLLSNPADKSTNKPTQLHIIAGIHSYVVSYHAAYVYSRNFAVNMSSNDRPYNYLRNKKYNAAFTLKLPALQRYRSAEFVHVIYHIQ